MLRLIVLPEGSGKQSELLLKALDDMDFTSARRTDSPADTTTAASN